MDGIFADDVWTKLYEPNFVGNPTIPQSTKENWYGNMVEFLEYAKERLGDYLLIPNTSDDGAFVDVCDGKWEENFVHARWASYGSFPSVSKWKRKIDAVGTVCQKGKIALVSGGCDQLEGDRSWVEANKNKVKKLLGFCFCSYLLGVNGDKSAFNFGTWWNRDGSRSYYSIFDDARQLGSPVSDYDEFGQVYARDFENGKVLVNPATSSRTVNLGGDYRTLDGQTVSSITLNPHTGLILLEQQELS